MKVKNAKTWLRKKGVISPTRKKKKIQIDDVSSSVTDGIILFHNYILFHNFDNFYSIYIDAKFEIIDLLSTDVKIAQEWLKRNREPFEDVSSNWKICQTFRLTKLINDKKITTEEYINQWSNILKQPQAYKLVYIFFNLYAYKIHILNIYETNNFLNQILDDFNCLHTVISKYTCLEGKQNNILINWPSISQKLQQLVISSNDIARNEIKDFIPILQNKDLSDGK